MKESFLLYRRLFAYIKHYWWVSVLSMLAMATAAVLTPLLMQQIKPLLDESLIARNAEAMWRVPLTILCIAIGKSIAEYIGNVASQWVSNKAVEDLRREVFNHQMKLSISSHQAQTSGRMLSRITYDIPQVGSALSTAWIVVIQDSLTIVALFFYLFWKAWHLTLIILVIGPVIAWVIRKASTGMRNSNRKQQSQMAEMTCAVEEQLAGLREIKIFGTQKHEESRFGNIARRLRLETMRVARISSLNVPLVQVLAFAAVSVVILIASSMAKSNLLTPGEFVAFLGTMAMIFEPIRRLTNINATIQRGLAGAQSIFELLDIKPEPDAGTHHIERARGEIRFENVSFTYPEQPSPAIQNLSLTINPGETVAFVGASGSGKTTLVALVTRFFEAQAGRILLDGVPIETIPLQELRSQFALVGQAAALFDDTISANIAYGLGDAKPEEIEHAAIQANAIDFIRAKPQGFGTRIGTNGNQLSGGQRQRLAIARAFVKNAPILLLDEATSALDNESERVVRESLVELRRNRTVLVVAHRLTTIRDSHRIVVMDKGQIVEMGTHEELLAANGAYARLLSSGEDVVADDAEGTLSEMRAVNEALVRG
jgi:subfamily B ATP-binding cassette protein MsbA